MITLVYAYFENAKMLERHLEEWQQYNNKDQYRAVIVDDCSKRNPAYFYVKDIQQPFPIELYRINTDIPWNQDGARNLAMTHTQGWCLITDMDHLLSKESAGQLLELPLDISQTYRPARIKAKLRDTHHPHPNSYLMHRENYWKIGGYDESYRGYYGTDGIFGRQVKKLTGITNIEIPLTLFGRTDIDDAATDDYGRHGSEYHISKSPDLMKRKKQKYDPIPPLNFKWERLL